jgi:hypothetical protein
MLAIHIFIMISFVTRNINAVSVTMGFKTCWHVWVHFGSIPASVVFFPTRHVASITRYLTNCRSKKVKYFGNFFTPLLLNSLAKKTTCVIFCLLRRPSLRHWKVTIWRGPVESCKKNGAGVTSASKFLHNLEYKQDIKKRRETCKLKWRL